MTEKPHTKFNELSSKQKREHIWEYYKLHIISGILVVMFFGWMLNHYIINPPADVTLDVTMFGTYYQQDNIYELQEALNEAVIDPELNETVFAEFFNMDTSGDPNMVQATMTKMVAKASLGEYDIMLFQGPYYQDYLQEAALLELDSLVEELNVDEEKLLKGSDLMYDSDSYYLIDVSDHETFSKIFLGEGPIYMGVFYKSAHMDNVLKGLNYILK